jgi:hypothetical protein
MIRIVCEPVVAGIGDEIARDLHVAHELVQPPVIVPQGAVWDAVPEWDDVLIVVYKTGLAPAGKEYIAAYRAAHPLSGTGADSREPGGLVIPVATDPGATKPPDPISGIKALLYDDAARGRGGRLADWVGIFLGLALRPGDQRIFISYRIADGTEIATDLYNRLEAAGFQPWLDEAKENLPPASDVQGVITENLKRASMVLVVDTPEAPKSRWIKVEVDAANHQMIPVLPVVTQVDRTRFVPLAYAQRQVLVKPAGIDRQPLSDEEWGRVLGKIEELLRLAYRRRGRTVFRTRQLLEEKGFDWIEQDQTRLIYRSVRPRQEKRPELALISHCCIHEATDIPALRAFRKYLDSYPDLARINFKLCVYDRDETLSEAEEEAIDDAFPERPFYLLHHSELPLRLPEFGIL